MGCICICSQFGDMLPRLEPAGAAWISKQRQLTTICKFARLLLLYVWLAACQKHPYIKGSSEHDAIASRCLPHLPRIEGM